ncbi:hypothetical protein [Peribacillus asahii]|uniref:hypothetical protein n=1 Tax=Peribacillus asahii TaxID=228899 RepID=UPI0037F81066
MAVPCIVMDAYIAPGSIMTQDRFLTFVDWIDFIYGVPGTFWGDQSPNTCRVDIRWRFRDPQNQNIPVMVPVDGPIIPPFNPQDPNSGIPFDNFPPDIESKLSERPAGTGPWGQTNPMDIAVYFTDGPFRDGFAGTIRETSNGPAIVVTNPGNGFMPIGTLLAHELGHLFLGNDHSLDPNNVMFATSSGTSFLFTPDQCNTISNSNRFQQCQ